MVLVMSLMTTMNVLAMVYYCANITIIKCIGQFRVIRKEYSIKNALHAYLR